MNPISRTDGIQAYHWVPAQPELRIPLVIDSPHSWPLWPQGVETLATPEQLMSGCDAYVDELWAGAAEVGAAVLVARFHRAYIDANRSERDIDVDLIDGAWPHPVEASDACRRGMGLIRRYALPRVPLYRRRLSVDEVEARIVEWHRPYRQALRHALDAAHRRFGAVWHLNCHSMKSVGNAMNVDCGVPRPDIVVSNSPRGEHSASPEFAQWAAERLRAHGYKVGLNTPYAGGDIVHANGCPSLWRHSLQIEINRALYMNEAGFEKHAGFERLKERLTLFVQELARHVEAQVQARSRAAS